MTEEATDNKPVDEMQVEVTAEELDSSKTGEESSDDGKETEKASGEGAARVEVESQSSGERRAGGDGGYSGHSSRGFGRTWPTGMSNDEKLKRYKKQSEERLLDIKRSREAKIGKKRGR